MTSCKKTIRGWSNIVPGLEGKKQATPCLVYLMPVGLNPCLSNQGTGSNFIQTKYVQIVAESEDTWTIHFALFL